VSRRGSVVPEIRALANLLNLETPNLSHPKSKAEMKAEEIFLKHYGSWVF